MTRLLVRVVDATEAAEAAAAGVDAIEVVAPANVALAEMQAVRGAFAGTLRLRRDGPAATAADGVADEIALAVDAPAPEVPSGMPVVALIGAGIDRIEAIAQAKARAGAVMLEAGAHGRLVDTPGVAELDAFAFACRAASLPFGLAGGLEAPDVARLLLLEPDVLGFDTAVRRGHRADAPLDRAALDAIRALIPRHGSTAAPRAPVVLANDRVFVRDLIVPMAIGAYQAEHGARQRVRFSVEADVERAPVPPHDMRDVFSYDVIIETIRVLAQRPHVTFVETLAEEVAAALIAHPSLAAVTVRVEKLDVIEGSVGIEITRRRPA